MGGLRRTLRVPSDPAPVLAPFTPASLSGLWAWYDAADASTFTLTGALVDQWRDKSGGGTNKTLLPNPNKPTRQLDGARMGVLSNTSGSNQLVAGAASAITPTIGTTAGFSCFVAARLVTVTGNSTIHRYTVAGGTDRVGYTYYTTTTIEQGFPAIVNTTDPDTNAHVLSCRWDDTTTGVKRNGVAEATGATPAPYNGIDRIYVGSAQLVGVVCWDGYIYEHITYNRVLTAGERAQVEAYLMAKWSIT